MQHTSNKWSRLAWYLCVCVMCYSGFAFYPRWSHAESEATISWDVSGYYWYLPSLFIYKDIKHQAFKDSIINRYHPANAEFNQAMQLPGGNYVMKYSSGMAAMYLPFFAVAHFSAGLFGYPRDGFSTPYQLAIQLGGFLVSVLGLWYLRKLLLEYYGDIAVAVTLFLLVAGTNYLEYATIDTGMSHCWLFTIYVFLLLNTHYFYQTFKIKYAIRIGLLVGLATLTRFTDVVSCLIPLLWGIDRISGPVITSRLGLFRRHARAFAVAVLCAFAVVSVQLIYWKYVSGHWFVYSYGDQGFSFKHPNFRPYTVSYRSGWLIYSPMLILALVGVIPFIRKGKNKVAILVFFLVNYYVVCSWDIWWYGGRAMIQSYPVLMFPMAALVQAAWNRKLLAWVLAPFALVFLYMNIWITYHYHKGALYDTDFMTKRYFWRVAGRWSAPANTVVLRDNTDLFEGTPKHMQPVYEHDFETDSGAFITPQAISGNKSLLVKANWRTPAISTPFTGKDMQWLRVQATFRCTKKEWDGWNMTQFVVKLKRAGETDTNKSARYNMLRVYRLLNENETKEISLDMKLPTEPYDSLQIWFKNELGDKELVVDNIKAWGFRE